MDTLSEVLRSVRLSGATFFNAEFGAPWGFKSPPADELGPLLSPGAGRVVIYHLVLEGRATAQLAHGGAQLTLEAGDVVVIPHGDPHSFWYGNPGRWLDALPAVRRALAGDLRLSRGGGDGPVTRFVCGYLACERLAGPLFLGGLAPILKVRLRDSPGGDWIERAIRYLGRQEAEGAGRLALLAKLSEALLVETLRQYIVALPATQTGWLAGARDPIAGHALALMHREPSQPWSLASLAREVGAARSVLIDRFRHFFGEAPISYLAHWRLQLGARMLETTARSVVEIASGVGYQSQASFNRAFKRRFDLPPARYRRQARILAAGAEAAARTACR